MNRFPQYLSRPLQVLWWEVDEFVIVIIFFMLAMMFGYVFYILMFIVPYLYSKNKNKYPRGFFKHILYFVGVLKLNGYPTYFEREFIE